MITIKKLKTTVIDKNIKKKKNILTKIKNITKINLHICVNIV